MRKTTYFVLALILVLGLVQCKKEQTNNTQNGNSVVMITLNVGGGASAGSATGNGSKVNVNPTDSPMVTFENGDQILVASGGKYVGTLTREEGVFTGSISNPVENQPFYFYFLGNKTPFNWTTNDYNDTISCTVNISDQRNYPHLPVISMGISNQTYPSAGNVYSSCLYNKCSLMKFNVTTPSTSAICITGMNNEVTVHFNNPTDSGFEYGMNAEDEGLIKMAGSSIIERWVIVLPQEALAEGAERSAYSEDNYFYGMRPALDMIGVNTIFNNGVSFSVNIADANIMVGGNTIGKWTNNGGDPWGGDTPDIGGNNLGGGWNNDGNDPWGN